MSELAELENLGVEFRLDGAGGLSVGGLRRLAPAGRHRALELARQHKGQIVLELKQRAGLAPESHFMVGMNVDKAEPAIDAQGANERLPSAGPAFEDQAGAGDGDAGYRGERHFPSAFNDWCYRLMVAEGVIQ
jgi:hypothetical protein